MIGEEPCIAGHPHGSSALETRLLTYVVEFRGVVCLHLSPAVASPITVRPRRHSSWELRARDVLSIFVGQLLEGTQATAETHYGVTVDAIIREIEGSLLQAPKTLL